MCLSYFFKETLTRGNYFALISLPAEGVLLFYLFQYRYNFNYRLIRFAILCEFLGIAHYVLIKLYVSLTVGCRYVQLYNERFVYNACAVAILNGIGFTAHILLIIERLIHICMPKFRQTLALNQRIQWIFYAAGVAIPVLYLLSHVPEIHSVVTEETYRYPNTDTMSYIQNMIFRVNIDYFILVLGINETMLVILLLVFLRFRNRLSPSERTRTKGVLLLEAAMPFQLSLVFIHKALAHFFGNEVSNAFLTIISFAAFLGVYTYQHLCFSWVYIVAFGEIREIFWTRVLRQGTPKRELAEEDGNQLNTSTETVGLNDDQTKTV